MSFKRKVTGFGRLAKNIKAMGIQISPQVGLADALEDGAWVIVMEARDNAVRQGLFLSGELIDSILPRKINQYRVDVRVGVPYGAAHEFGVTVVIKAKQRRFFWAKYMSTGDTMWKALALSETYTIPAKPYVRPAIDTRSQAAYTAASRSILKRIRSVIT